MSSSEIAWALSQSHILPIDKFVLMAMADSSCGVGLYHGGFRAVNRFTNIDIESYEESLGRLISEGLIAPIDNGFSLSGGAEEFEGSSAYKKKKISQSLRMQVYLRDGCKCLRCGETSKDRLSADHVIPESIGGDTSLDNLQTLCRSCNSRKGRKTIDFRRD